jgi:hypothetical protein
LFVEKFISSNSHHNSSSKLDGRYAFVPIPEGNDKCNSFLALVSATKNSLLSSSICSKFEFCKFSEFIWTGIFSKSLVFFPSQFQLYKPGINT